MDPFRVTRIPSPCPCRLPDSTAVLGYVRGHGGPVVCSRSGRFLDPRTLARIYRVDRARQDAGSRWRSSPTRSGDGAPSDRRARHARAEDARQPRRGRAKTAREPDVRSPCRVRRRAECVGHVKAVLALVLACSACREVDTVETSAPPAIAASQTRILYPAAPGSFVDLVANARHGVVAIHAAQPVKSGPAA